MNYEEMSDFEVNGYVSMHMHGFSWIEFVDGCTSHVKCGNECSPGFSMIEVPDYCNNPSDAWPIIFSSRTMLNPYCADELWKAEVPCGFDGFVKVYATCYHRNPLRAAMIVFLMMQERVK